MRCVPHIFSRRKFFTLANEQVDLRHKRIWRTTEVRLPQSGGAGIVRATALLISPL